MDGIHADALSTEALHFTEGRVGHSSRQLPPMKKKRRNAAKAAITQASGSQSMVSFHCVRSDAQFKTAGLKL